MTNFNTYLCKTKANDRLRLCLLKVACCDEGFKLLMDVILCEAPCCPGLREFVTNDTPHLGHVIACQAQQHVRLTL